MDETENDLTPDEETIEADTGADAEESHRIGEFDDLRDRLEGIDSKLDGIIDALAQMRTTAEAIDIDNGADVRDVDGDGDAGIIEDEVIIPDYEDLDLDL